MAAEDVPALFEQKVHELSERCAQLERLLKQITPQMQHASWSSRSRVSDALVMASSGLRRTATTFFTLRPDSANMLAYIARTARGLEARDPPPDELVGVDLYPTNAMELSFSAALAEHVCVEAERSVTFRDSPGDSITQHVIVTATNFAIGGGPTLMASYRECVRMCDPGFEAYEPSADGGAILLYSPKQLIPAAGRPFDGQGIPGSSPAFGAYFDPTRFAVGEGRLDGGDLVLNANFDAFNGTLVEGPGSKGTGIVQWAATVVAAFQEPALQAAAACLPSGRAATLLLEFLARWLGRGNPLAMWCMGHIVKAALDLQNA